MIEIGSVNTFFDQTTIVVWNEHEVWLNVQTELAPLADAVHWYKKKAANQERQSPWEVISDWHDVSGMSSASLERFMPLAWMPAYHLSNVPVFRLGYVPYPWGHERCCVSEMCSAPGFSTVDKLEGSSALSGCGILSVRWHFLPNDISLCVCRSLATSERSLCLESRRWLTSSRRWKLLRWSASDRRCRYCFCFHVVDTRQDYASSYYSVLLLVGRGGVAGFTVLVRNSSSRNKCRLLYNLQEAYL